MLEHMLKHVGTCWNMLEHVGTYMVLLIFFHVKFTFNSVDPSGSVSRPDPSSLGSTIESLITIDSILKI